MDKYYTKNNIKYIKTVGNCSTCELFGVSDICEYEGNCEFNFCYKKLSKNRKEKIKDLLK